MKNTTTTRLNDLLRQHEAPDPAILTAALREASPDALRGCGDDMPPLTRAVRAGWPHAVFALLAFGADVNAPDDVGLRPLHHAALQGDGEIASLLLAAGAETNAVPTGEVHEGMTALSLAAWAGHALDEQDRWTPLTHLLIEQGGAVLETDGIPAADPLLSRTLARIRDTRAASAC